MNLFNLSVFCVLFAVLLDESLYVSAVKVKQKFSDTVTCTQYAETNQTIIESPEKVALTYTCAPLMAELDDSWKVSARVHADCSEHLEYVTRRLVNKTNVLISGYALVGSEGECWHNVSFHAKSEDGDECKECYVSNLLTLAASKSGDEYPESTLSSSYADSTEEAIQGQEKFTIDLNEVEHLQLNLTANRSSAAPLLRLEVITYKTVHKSGWSQRNYAPDYAEASLIINQDSSNVTESEIRTLFFKTADLPDGFQHLEWIVKMYDGLYSYPEQSFFIMNKDSSGSGSGSGSGSNPGGAAVTGFSVLVTLISSLVATALILPNASV